MNYPKENQLNNSNNNKCDNLYPVDWGTDLIIGVTIKNKHSFPPYGLSLAKAQILTDEECENERIAFATSIGSNLQALKFQHQVHGSEIMRINFNSGVQESDGLITNERGIQLCALLADCCGILLYDEHNHAIGSIHSGWKGTHQRISVNAVNAMKLEFGTRPEKLKAYLSPCASGEIYEVEKDVADLFRIGITKLNNTKYLFDNRSAIYDQLIMECGLLAHNITVSKECSIRDTRFHSFRRDGKSSGRMAAFIGLR